MNASKNLGMRFFEIETCWCSDANLPKNLIEGCLRLIGNAISFSALAMNCLHSVFDGGEIIFRL